MLVKKNKLFILLLILFFVFVFYFPKKQANAANLVSITDMPSKLKISTGSDHSIQFTSPSGVAAGQTITLTFESSFGIGAVDDTDLDVEDDGFDLLLGPIASGATWGASFAGNILTITSGTGTIAGGSVINLKIGLNASYQFAGDAQITNPSSVGGANIWIAGTFGDIGNLTIPIVDDDAVGVFARVGGGAVIVDTTPPTCSNIQVTDITRETARITWETNENSTSAVDYGKTITYELGTITDFALVMFHQLDLSGLDPQTVYYVKVVSRDAAGNVVVCGETTFETLGQPLLYIRAIPEKRLPSVGNNSTILRVLIFQQSTSTIVLDGTVTTDKDGFDRTLFFPEYTSLPKDYDFLLKGYSHLQKRFNKVTLTPDLELKDLSFGVTIFLLAGDVNGVSGDNYVNGLDLGVLTNHLYTDDYRNDLNQDKYVNGLEYAIAVTNLYRWGDF